MFARYGEGIGLSHARWGENNTPRAIVLRHGAALFAIKRGYNALPSVGRSVDIEVAVAPNHHVIRKDKGHLQSAIVAR